MIELTTGAPPSVLIHPRRQLQRQSLLVSAVLIVPVSAAVLWFSIPRGTWPRLLIALAVIGLAYGAASILFSRISIRVTSHALIERGFLGSSRRIPVKRIETVLLLDLYSGPSVHTVPQLFLLDASGELLLRVRGPLWNSADIAMVAQACGAPIRRVDEPLSKADLRAEHGQLLFWLERWPTVQWLCVAGAIAVGALLLIAAVAPESLSFS